MFYYYLIRLKAREISSKKWKSRKIFSILNLASCSNNYLNVISWNNWPSWIIFLLSNFCQVDLLEEHFGFKISSIGAPLTTALEVDVDLVEWALIVPM